MAIAGGELGLYRRIARQARAAWPRILALFLVGLLASPLAVLGPLPLKIAVDHVLGGQPLPPVLDAVLPDGVTGSATVLLLLVAALALLIALLSQVQSLTQKYLTASAGERLVLQFRGTIFRHLQRLSLSYHDATGSADAVYRIQNDAPALQKIVIEGLIPTLSSAATLAGMIYVMLRLDWQLSLVALAVSPPLFLATRFYRPRLRRQSRAVRKLESAAMAVVHEALGALRVVKAFGQEGRETERFTRSSDQGVRGRIGLALAESRFNLIVGLVTAAGTAAVLFVGIGHVRAGVLSLGELLMLMGYVGKLYDPMKTISRKVASLQGHLASAERTFALLDLLPDVTERPDARPVTRATGAIAFRDVSFAYGTQPVLHGVTFDIPEGTHLGIAGTTGAGKSTLISLVTRLYDPSEGRILLDGVDLRDYRLDDLRRQFAVVHQEPVLFSTSIAENIAYAAPGATRERIEAAARAADAHEFIVRLPQGYDTQVGERGVKLSGGQRQRIALARACLKDSPVLILDEPTSAVDAQTEAGMVEALERLKRGRTVIVISHRPSTLAGCSEVLVLDHGRVVGDTARLFAPEPTLPPATPRPAVSAGQRRDQVLAHPAVRAWQRLGSDRPLPTRIAPAKLRPYKRQTAVYRLDGVGPDGGAVIAKRCKRGDGLIERAVYEEFLPRLPLPAADYVGCVEDPAEDVTWLFTQEVSGELYAHRDHAHRAFAARWIGRLHAGAQAIGRHPALPEADPRRYLVHLRRARDIVREHSHNPVLTGEDIVFLEALIARLDDLESRWDRLEAICDGMPQTLVHGDFNGKNLRVRSGGKDPGIVVFDWEDAGWGPPAVDLAQLTFPASRISAGPDLAMYWDVVRKDWPEYDRSDIERLAYCGTVLRSLAVFDWESRNLAYEWAQWYIGSIRLYDAELEHALGRLGWTHSRGWSVEWPARSSREALGV